jgi:preprotein translocase subunit SecB
MEVSEQPKLRFHGVDFVRVDFMALKPSMAGETKTNLSVVPHVWFPKNALSSFKIFVEINVSRAESFSLEIVAIGHFETNKEIDEDIKKTLVNQNAVAILFPFLRSFVTTLTSNVGAGIEPIILPIQFFKGEIDEMPEEPSENKLEGLQLELPKPSSD